MLKNTMLLIGFLIGSFAIFAQKPDFSFHAGYQALNLTADNHIEESRTFTLIDSVTFLSTDALTESSYHFETKPGFQAGFKVHFPITKSVNVVTGLGLSFQRFDSERRNVDITNLFTNPDTVKLISSSGSFDRPCDTYVNFPADVINGFSIRNNLLFLTIPILLETKTLNDKLSVQIGGFIATPLASTVSRAWYRQEMNTITDNAGNELTECNHFPITEKDKTGNGFKNFVSGIEIRLAYLIWKNISVEAGLSQTLGSYYSGRNQFFAVPNDGIETSAMQVSAGFRINLAKE